MCLPLSKKQTEKKNTENQPKQKNSKQNGKSNYIILF